MKRNPQKAGLSALVQRTVVPTFPRGDRRRYGAPGGDHGVLGEHRVGAEMVSGTPRTLHHGRAGRAVIPDAMEINTLRAPQQKGKGKQPGVKILDIAHVTWN